MNTASDPQPEDIRDLTCTGSCLCLFTNIFSHCWLRSLPPSLLLFAYWSRMNRRLDSPFLWCSCCLFALISLLCTYNSLLSSLLSWFVWAVYLLRFSAFFYCRLPSFTALLWLVLDHNVGCECCTILVFVSHFNFYINWPSGWLNVTYSNKASPPPLTVNKESAIFVVDHLATSMTIINVHKLKWI